MTRVSSYRPLSMAVEAGAGLGDSFSVRLAGEELVYELRDHEARACEERSGPITAGAWRSFRRTLEALEAATWLPRYDPPAEEMRTDGVDWHVEIEYADGMVVRSSGYEAYPPDGSTDRVSPQFRRLCRAVSRLLGGLEFGWEVATPPVAKGSRLRMHEWRHLRRERLEGELCRQVPSLRDFVSGPGAGMNWIAPDWTGREIRDGLWPLVLPPPTPQEDGFWPGGGPVWDAAAHVAGDDGLGILLVEAKSHAQELRSPRMRSSSYEVDKRRRESLDEAKAYCGVAPDVSWTLTYYQYANRLAFLYYLRVRRKQPTWLVNIYFCGDRFRSGGAMIAGPTDAAEWSTALSDVKRALGLPTRHPLSEYVAEVFLPASPDLGDPGGQPLRRFGHPGTA